MNKSPVDPRWATGEIPAAYRHVESMVYRADSVNGQSPMWYGWAVREAFLAGAQWQRDQPIDMVLHCPACGMQHIDEADADDEQTTHSPMVERWTNPPHRSHLCQNSACRHVWRPADVATNGVATVKTKGTADSPIVTPRPER